MHHRTVGSVAVRAAVLTLGVLLAATACSSSKSSKASSSAGSSASTSATASPSQSASGSASASASTSPVGTSVTVGEKEYSLTLSQTQFAPGTYTFTAQNNGTVEHALAISGPGLTQVQTPTLSPGSSAQLTVTLQGGSYELWCPIDAHKSLGMDTHIQVGSAGGGATGSTASPSSSGSASSSASATGTTSASASSTSTATSGGGY